MYLCQSMFISKHKHMASSFISGNEDKIALNTEAWWCKLRDHYEFMSEMIVLQITSDMNSEMISEVISEFAPPSFRNWNIISQQHFTPSTDQGIFFVIIHEKWSELISQKMTNDDEIVWNVKSDSQGNTQPKIHPIPFTPSQRPRYIFLTPFWCCEFQTSLGS